MNKERRMATVSYREGENDGKMIIEGYALRYDSPATYNGFTEVIAPGALDGADLSDVPLRYNHEDSYLILARTRNESLMLTPDNVGLHVLGDLIDTKSNEDVYKSVKAGLLDKMSFAFTVADESYDYQTNTRTIMKFDKIWDVSIVDVPYYEQTSVSARKLDTSLDYFAEREKEKRKMLADKIARKELLKRL